MDFFSSIALVLLFGAKWLAGYRLSARRTVARATVAPTDVLKFHSWPGLYKVRIYKSASGSKTDDALCQKEFPSLSYTKVNCRPSRFLRSLNRKPHCCQCTKIVGAIHDLAKEDWRECPIPICNRVSRDLYKQYKDDSRRGNHLTLRQIEDNLIGGNFFNMTGGTGSGEEKENQAKMRNRGGVIDYFIFTMFAISDPEFEREFRSKQEILQTKGKEEPYIELFLSLGLAHFMRQKLDMEFEWDNLDKYSFDEVSEACRGASKKLLLILNGRFLGDEKLYKSHCLD